MIYVMQNEHGEQYWIFRINEMRVYDDINEYSSELEFEDIKTYNVIDEHEYNALLSMYNLHNTSTDPKAGMMYMDMYDTLQQQIFKNSTPMINEIMKNLE